MASSLKALVFDLGGVLLTWDHRHVNALTSKQFMTVTNSMPWHNLNKGLISLQTACEEFGKLLGVESSVIEKALEEAQLSLTANTALIQTIYDLRAYNKELKFYVMSNISREHFEIVRALDIPWDIFEYVFASGIEGMRKPELCSFQYMIEKIGCLPHEILLIDDLLENTCAARSIGMQTMLVDNNLVRSGGALRNLIRDPVPRAEAFLKANAGAHHCVVEGHPEIALTDNFAQLMIWDVTGDENIVYLKWPSGRLTGPKMEGNYESNDHPVDQGDVKNGLWNYFTEDPVLTTTATFPHDADTTSIAYRALPPDSLKYVADPKLVLDLMAENTDRDGIMETYFCDDRPRTTPEICCNILIMFHQYGHASDPRIIKTEKWVVDCLKNKSCEYGNRHYTILEIFLYGIARLYAVCAKPALKKELEVVVKQELRERLNLPINPAGLALRLAACQLVGVEPDLYRRDLERLRAVQDEDGGWPAGHFTRIGRTGVRIGNRGLTTALALKIFKFEEAENSK